MEDLTQGKVAGKLLRFTAPILLGSVFQQLYNVVDSIIVGQVLGDEALSAVGASFPVQFLLIAVVSGISGGASVVVAQHFGAGRQPEVKGSIHTFLLFLLAASAVVMALGLFLGRRIFVWTQLPESVLDMATLYLDINLLGVWALFGFNGISYVLRALGDSKTPFYYLLISTLTNIVFDLAFVVWLDMGVAGAAWATVLSQAGALLTGLWHLGRKHPELELRPRSIRFEARHLRDITRVGLPSGLQQLLAAGGLTALYGLVNPYGTTIVAAYSVAMKIESFALLPSFGLARALTVFVGQNCGAGKQERIGLGLRATGLVAAAFALSGTALVVLARGPLFRLFTTDEQVVAAGGLYLSIVAPFYLCFYWMIALGAIYRGVGLTWVPTLVSLFSLWVFRLPLSWWLDGAYGLHGLWWGTSIGWLAGMLMALAFHLGGGWRKAFPKAP